MCAVVQTPGDRTRRSGWRENSMMACSGTCRGGAGDDGDGEILRQRRAWVYRQRQGQNCTKLSPIESILQYRFATPKPLKTRPAPDCCETAPLCNPGRCRCITAAGAAVRADRSAGRGFERTSRALGGGLQPDHRSVERVLNAIRQGRQRGSETMALAASLFLKGVSPPCGLFLR